MPMKCVEQEIASKISIPDPKVSCKAFDTKINWWKRSRTDSFSYLAVSKY